MNDNGNIRLLTPENDMRVRAFFSSLEDLSKRVEKIRNSNKPSLDGERYYNDKELAVKLKVSRRSLQDYRNNGILPYVRVGGKILYRASDIERVLMDGYKEAYRLNRCVIVKTCSDICFPIVQKNCPMFALKLRNFHHSHNRMGFYPSHSVL